MAMWRLLRRGWATYSHLLDTHPLRTKATTALVVFSTSDAVRQRIEHEIGPFSWDSYRTARLAGFYAIVHAPWVHYWYGILERVVGTAITPRNTILKIAADQLIAMPVFMAVLLGTQTLLCGHNLEYCRAKLQRDWIPTIQGTWMCWIPALAVAFACVPLKFRLLYVNGIQVCFGVFISKQANSPLHPVPAAAAPSPTTVPATAVPSPTTAPCSLAAAAPSSA